MSNYIYITVTEDHGYTNAILYKRFINKASVQYVGEIDRGKCIIILNGDDRIYPEETYEEVVRMLQETEAPLIQKENSLDIRVKLDDGAKIPEKANPTDAGYDLVAIEDCTIFVGQFSSINTGVHIELPTGYFGRVCGRSGLDHKYGISCHSGTVDCDYRGAIRVCLHNHSQNPYVIHKGDRIGQLIIMKLPEIGKLVAVDELTETERGSNGFGSTGR